MNFLPPYLSQSFFYLEMDYVLFLYGLACIVLAGVCTLLLQLKDRPLSWPWLGLFALSHGLHHWLRMVAISHNIGGWIVTISLMTQALSFLFLLEFARQSHRLAFKKSLGLWIYPPLLGIIILWNHFQPNYLVSIITQVLGIPATLWTALLFWRAGKSEPAPHRWLQIGSLFLFAYVIVTLFSTPPGGGLAVILNQELFFRITQCPIELISIIPIMGLSLCLRKFNRREHETTFSKPEHKPIRSTYLIVLILITLGGGWGFTERVGHKADSQTRHYILDQVNMGAAAVEGRRIQELQGFASDLQHPNYQRIRRLLGKMNPPGSRTRCVYLLFQHDNKIHFSADSLSKNDPQHAEPGVLYTNPPQGLADVFTTGQPIVVGPYTDEWGSFVSAFAPVYDTNSSRVIATLGLDIEREQWLKQVAEWRLGAIEITLLISTLLITFFVTRQRLLDNADRIAVNERRMAEAQRVALIGSWDWIPSANRLECTKEACRIMGQPDGPPMVTMEEYMQMVHPDDRPAVAAVATQALQQKVPFSVEHRVPLPDGSERVVLQRGQAVFDDHGLPIRVIGTTQDITERKKMENALRVSEAQFRMLFEHAPMAIVTLRHSVILSGNPEFKKIAGLRPDEDYVGRPLSEFLAPECRDFVCERNLRREQGLPEPTEYEVTARRADGSPCPLQVSVSLMEFPDGPVVVVFFQDVTERKRTERELQTHRELLEEMVRERTKELTEANCALQEEVSERRRTENLLKRSEARMRLFFERQIVGMAITSPQKQFIQVNDRLCEMFGYSREELTQLTWSGLTHPEDLPQNVNNFNDLAAAKIESFTAEKRFIRKDGAIVYSSIAVGCVRNPDGSLDYVLLLVEDITARKLAEMETRKLLAELERSNKELEQFAYVASHDLQEPLRLVSAYTQMLMQRYRPKLDADADPIVKFITDGVTRMQQLIQDLLSYSRVSSRSKPFALVEGEQILQTALNNLAISIRESQATITHDPLPELFCDPTQIGQLFQNLIANALKFHGQETPKIHIGVVRSSGLNDWLISISDNGIGIEPEFHERIFIIFQRLHSRAKYKGTGIGLAICKRVVERHGGRIWVESKPGNGAIFYFTIPIPPSSHDTVIANE